MLEFSVIPQRCRGADGLSNCRETEAALVLLPGRNPCILVADLIQTKTKT